MVFSIPNGNQHKYPGSQNPKVASHSGGCEVSVVSVFPFQDKASYVCAKQECYMIYPLTGAKRKITGRVEEGKMAPERKKSQTKFGISPFISPQTLPTHKPDSVSDVSNVFIVPSPSPAPNPRKKVGRGKKKNQCHTDVFIPSCLDKRLLSSTVHIFQAESLHA